MKIAVLMLCLDRLFKSASGNFLTPTENKSLDARRCLPALHTVAAHSREGVGSVAALKDTQPFVDSSHLFNL